MFILEDKVTESKINPNAPARDPWKVPRQSPPISTSMTRQVEVTLFRLFSGHANTRIHGSRVGWNVDVDETKCRWCELVPETAEHLMLECRKVWNGDRTSLDRLRRIQLVELKGDLTFARLFDEREGPIYDAVVAVVEDLVERGVRL